MHVFCVECFSTSSLKIREQREIKGEVLNRGRIISIYEMQFQSWPAGKSSWKSDHSKSLEQYKPVSLKENESSKFKRNEIVNA